MNTTLWLILFLFTKHFVIDYPLQVRYQYSNKGTYGHPGGLLHAGLHGVGTFLCFYWFAPEAALYLAWIDATLHYHIDWAKMNWGNRDITTKAFWAHLGLDQMLHQITYILLLVIAVS